MSVEHGCGATVACNVDNNTRRCGSKAIKGRCGEGCVWRRRFRFRLTSVWISVRLNVPFFPILYAYLLKPPLVFAFDAFTSRSKSRSARVNKQRARCTSIVTFLM